MSRSISSLGGIRCSKSNSLCDELWTLLDASPRLLACLKRLATVPPMLLEFLSLSECLWCLLEELLLLLPLAPPPPLLPKPLPEVALSSSLRLDREDLPRW